MWSKLSEVELLTREVHFLRLAERASQRLVEAEVAGTLARKAGKSAYSNPHNRAESLDVWTSWALGWSNEDRAELLQKVTDVALGLFPSLVARCKSGEASPEEAKLLDALVNYHQAVARPDVVGDDSLSSMP